MEILKYQMNLEELLSEKYVFYAHTGGKEKKQTNGTLPLEDTNDPNMEPETLAQHTGRCINYQKQMIKDRNLEGVFVNLEGFYLEGAEEKYLELFRAMLANVVVFHDIGKINPLFQKDIMKNPQFVKAAGSVEFGSKHSIISAILYLEKFLFVIKEMEAPLEIRKKLFILVYLNAYIISRHHSSLEKFTDFLNSFSTKSRCRYEIIKEEYKNYFKDGGAFLQNGYCIKYADKIKKYISDTRNEKPENDIFLYLYEKLVYSLLIAADYYATTEYNEQYFMKKHGTIEGIHQIIDAYHQTKVMKAIREYEKGYKKEDFSIASPGKKDFDNRTETYTGKEINALRSELFLNAEKMLDENKEQNLFYLEAPTGSGKSNTALNLSFQLIRHCPEINRIWYVYPFNTLVEQNIRELKKIFSGQEEIEEQIQVVNSITPIMKNVRFQDKKGYDAEKEEEEEINYTKMLLDRQFFNYPITLTTHVTLFNIMFQPEKESGFPFYQLANSVIVLDEIQSYRNKIWTEIIIFLKAFSKMLNIKIIIMSATLPNLDLLSEEQSCSVKLIADRDKYFQNPQFRNRVRIHYELLDSGDIILDLMDYINRFVAEGKKIIIEFITKKSAEKFYKIARQEMTVDIEFLSGDSNSIERKRILEKMDNLPKEVPFLLVSTQVIEAGVDVKNANIGFKDISILDAEEQFMGRINRSCASEGDVYFFHMDNARNVYDEDVRVNSQLTLEAKEMRDILKEKDFHEYYKKVFEKISQANDSLNTEKNTEVFWKDKVAVLDNEEIGKRMYLIQNEQYTVPVFFARNLQLPDGDSLNGEDLWKQYKALLQNKDMGYAEWRVRLSVVKSSMNYFIHQIREWKSLVYNDRVGDMLYISDGEIYFTNGKLDLDRLENQFL